MSGPKEKPAPAPAKEPTKEAVPAVAEPAGTPSDVAAIVVEQLKKLSKGKADSLLASLTAEVAAQEAEDERTAVVGKAETLLASMKGKILEILPPGKTLVVFHQPKLTEGDKVTREASLNFNVNIGSGVTVTGSTAPKKSGGGKGGKKPLIRVTLADGATVIEDTSMNAVLYKLNPHLPPESKFEDPGHSYNARGPLMERVQKLGAKFEEVPQS